MIYRVHFASFLLMSTKPGPEILNDDLIGRVDQSELLDLIGYNVRRAYLVIQAHFETKMERLALRRTDFAVLSTLRGNPGINQKALAEALAIAPPNLATLLDRLELAGLIVRQRSTDDKRNQLVSLTPQGTKLQAQAVKAARKADEAATRSLSDEERDTLRRLLTKIFQD